MENSSAWSKNQLCWCKHKAINIMLWSHPDHPRSYFVSQVSADCLLLERPPLSIWFDIQNFIQTKIIFSSCFKKYFEILNRQMDSKIRRQEKWNTLLNLQEIILTLNLNILVSSYAVHIKYLSIISKYLAFISCFEISIYLAVFRSNETRNSSHGWQSIGIIYF